MVSTRPEAGAAVEPAVSARPRRSATIHLVEREDRPTTTQAPPRRRHVSCISPTRTGASSRLGRRREHVLVGDVVAHHQESTLRAPGALAPTPQRCLFAPCADLISMTSDPARSSNSGWAASQGSITACAWTSSPIFSWGGTRRRSAARATTSFARRWRQETVPAGAGGSVASGSMARSRPPRASTPSPAGPPRHAPCSARRAERCEARGRMFRRAPSRQPAAHDGERHAGKRGEIVNQLAQFLGQVRSFVRHVAAKGKQRPVEIRPEDPERVVAAPGRATLLFR